jgi:hypothetical protein
MEKRQSLTLMGVQKIRVLIGMQRIKAVLMKFQMGASLEAIFYYTEAKDLSSLLLFLL